MSEIATGEILTLPDGQVLTPGGKVHMSAEQVLLIPKVVIDKHRLKLGITFNPPNDLVIWPKPKVHTPKKVKPPTYIHLHRVEIPRALEAIHSHDGKHDFDGFLVGINSLRLQTFKYHGTKCVGCGVEGSYFSIDTFGRNSQKQSAHMNLYAVRADGSVVLMTHDHIVPRSKDGPDVLSNTQTMCVKCNVKKADK